MSDDKISEFQQHLVNATWSTNNHDFDANSLAIYRTNIKASAIRSLAISYPTIAALVGEHYFSALIERYIAHHPFIYGDWGLWGQDFSTWLSLQDSVSRYPYLPDCAQLDWQCHLLERAKRNQPALTLNNLEAQHLERARIQYAVGTQIIQSNYPIVDIWQAHQPSNLDQQAELLEQSKQKLALQQGQNALIWRPKWKAHVRLVGGVEMLWIQLTSANNTISESLPHMTNTDFSLIDWLPKAFAERLVCGFIT